METKLIKNTNGEFEMGYYVFLPRDYKCGSDKKYPMIVFLHGAGERGNGRDELERVCKHGLAKYAREGMDIPAILVCPQCPALYVWNNMVFLLKKLIDSAAEEYGADKSRISITGASMGGFGSWEMALTYPNFFSAVAPICGGGLSWRCGSLKNMPIWAFHGDADDCVPLKNSVEMVDAVNANGGNAKLTIFHNVYHNSWDSAYLETKVIDWLVTQERNDFERPREPFL